jgi:hypothetical protein
MLKPNKPGLEVFLILMLATMGERRNGEGHGAEEGEEPIR